MIVQSNQRVKMFSVWYWNKNRAAKWVTVYSLDKESAIKEIEALDDFYRLDSIDEQ